MDKKRTLAIFLVIVLLGGRNCFSQHSERSRLELSSRPQRQGKIGFILDKMEEELKRKEGISCEKEERLTPPELMSGKDEIIKKTLRNITIEISLAYLAARGEQRFELLNSQEGMASRLIYPIKGEMTIFKGEIGFLSKFFLGGRYGNSSFKKTICSDEDWGIYDPTRPYGSDDYVDYQITKQDCPSKVELFDINLYCRLLDLDKEDIEQRQLLCKKDNIFDCWRVDSLSLDIFAGYQQQNGRFRMIDPMSEFLRFDEGSWYYATTLPANIGLDSFYKIKYKGPRIGLRAKGSKGRVTTTAWFVYAWLDTEAYGWWNLRDLAYWQKGKNGYGIDLGFEVTYPFTSWFSAGIGFNYLYSMQKKLEMYAVEAGVPWWEGYQERVRNAASKVYGPLLIARCIW